MTVKARSHRTFVQTITMSKVRRLLSAGFLSALAAGCKPGPPESASANAPSLECEGSSPIALFGRDTGFSRCSNGMRHRPRAVECASFLPRAGDGVPYLREYMFLYDEVVRDHRKHLPCVRDSDCSARAHGHCEPSQPVAATHCAYGCVNDSECSPGELCLCDDPVGHCVPASCRSDSDCAPPFVCGDYHPFNAPCGVSDAFACQTEGDECAAQCGPGGIHCSLVQGRRTCARNCSVR